MNSSFKKKILKGSVLLIAVASLAGCAAQSPVDTTPTMSPTPTATPTPTPTVAESIVYDNTMYGFSFTLPLSWTGYSIVTSAWQGWSSATGKVVQTGEMISIRHPLWTEAVKRQDIPILVYTLAQWTALGKNEFNMGAAPIPPSELARNAKYVFALPARYNYAFPAGYQEVDQILQGNPLHAS